MRDSVGGAKRSSSELSSLPGGVFSGTSFGFGVGSGGNERVFIDALKSYKHKSAALKAFYAKSLMNYAYQSAVLGDRVGYRTYIRRSILIRVTSIKQVIMFMFSFFPGVAVLISRKRNDLRYG